MTKATLENGVVTINMPEKDARIIMHIFGSLDAPTEVQLYKKSVEYHSVIESERANDLQIDAVTYRLYRALRVNLLPDDEEED